MNDDFFFFVVAIFIALIYVQSLISFFPLESQSLDARNEDETLTADA